jgi:predicted phage baseplate assembly protein
MALRTPNLDDRHFQDIVDEAKRLIPRYCPEWTDHNVSDPGVALIELFAWMTDMLLYRVNQVPDKLYIKFLEMIGVRLDPPRSARAPVTFYLSAAQPNDVTIPQDTEVATIRTETSPAIIFTTEEPLTIRPPVMIGAFTRDNSRGGSGWTTHDLRQLELPGRKIAMFPTPPGPGDALYLAFEHDHSNHVLALLLECELAGGAGVDPRNPPVEWQVWQGGITRWAKCEVEHDFTLGFNQSGEIILHLPHMARDTLQGLLQGKPAYWLRCRLTEAQAGPASYKVSPDLELLQAEARGGTVGTRHAVTVSNEVLGRSDGTPEQEFKLLHTPILARDAQTDYLAIDLPDGTVEHWQEVDDFANSKREDKHYTLDSQEGTLTLGPALLQPDGSVYSFGAVAPQGGQLRFNRYQYGGGVIGNVPQNALTVLKTSIPYVARVANRQPAVGGRDPQGLEDAKLRAPQVLRTRTRAMTTDDYEHLACEVAGAARAHCLSPGAQPGGPNDPKPGQVFVIVLPQTDTVQGRIPPEVLTLQADLRNEVLNYQNARRPLGITLDVRQVKYIWVSIQATLRLPRRSDPALIAEVQQRAEAELYHYLNPYIGGPQGNGWPFGRDLHVSEIYGLLQRIPAVEFVDEVQIGISEPGSTAAPQIVAPRLDVPHDGLICSEQHRVTIKLEGAS